MWKGWRTPPGRPRTNLVGNPYFTDGLRLVLFLSDQPQPLNLVEVLAWAQPAF